MLLENKIDMILNSNCKSLRNFSVNVFNSCNKISILGFKNFEFDIFFSEIKFSTIFLRRYETDFIISRIIQGNNSYPEIVKRSYFKNLAKFREGNIIEKSGLNKKLILKSPKEEVLYYIIKKQFEFNIKNILEDLFEAYFFTKYSKNLPKFFIIILEYNLFDNEIDNIKKKVDIIFKNKGGIYKDYNAKIYANFDEIRIITYNNIVHYFSKRSNYSCILIQKDMRNFMSLNLLTNKTNYFLIIKKNNFDEIKMMIK